MKVYEYEARVIDVYDGDTYTLVLQLGGIKITHEVVIRMLRIDTPEVKLRKGRYKYPEEIEIGKKITEWVENRILNKTVSIYIYGGDEKDVYGRYLVDLFYEVDGQAVHLNQQMLDLGFDKKTIQEKLESSTAIEIPA